MQVKELIKILKKLNPEEKIIIQYYDQEDAELWWNEKPATLEQWEEVVSGCDNLDFQHFRDNINDVFIDIIQEEKK